MLMLLHLHHLLFPERTLHLLQNINLIQLIMHIHLSYRCLYMLIFNDGDGLLEVADTDTLTAAMAMGRCTSDESHRQHHLSNRCRWYYYWNLFPAHLSAGQREKMTRRQDDSGGDGIGSWSRRFNGHGNNAIGSRIGCNEENP